MKTQILLGTLLGDAYIGKARNKNHSLSIGWEHCQKQEEYALWKAENCLDNYSFYKRSRLDSRTGKIYHSIICYSRKDDYQYYRELFYRDKKEVSQEILDKLEPLAIAVWFMDDGNLYYNGNICHLTLSVDGFNEESVNRIINYFSTIYNITFKKRGVGKGLRITSVKQVELFESHFKNFYHDSMIYKTLNFNKEKYERRRKEKKENFRDS